MGLQAANLAATAKRGLFPVELDVTNINGSAVGAMGEVPIGNQTGADAHCHDFCR